MYRGFFGKSICFIFILFISICFLSCVVQANDEGIMPLESIYEYGECYRDMLLTQLEDGSYSLWYRIYNSGGLQENTVIIPSEMYELKNWLIYVSANGTANFVKAPNQSDNVINFYSYYLWNRWNYEFDGKGVYRCYYKYDTDTWTDFVYYDEITTSFESMHANNFLISKGVYITYEKGGVPYSLCIDYQNLFTPYLQYLVGEGFRLQLRDFHGSTEVNDTYSLEKSLTNIHFTVHDLNSNINIIDTMDLLSYSDVSQDAEGQYYIDIKFSDLLTTLRSKERRLFIYICFKFKK